MFLSYSFGIVFQLLVGNVLTGQIVLRNDLVDFILSFFRKLVVSHVDLDDVCVLAQTVLQG